MPSKSAQHSSRYDRKNGSKTIPQRVCGNRQKHRYWALDTRQWLRSEWGCLIVASTSNSPKCVTENTKNASSLGISAAEFTRGSSLQIPENCGGLAELLIHHYACSPEETYNGSYSGRDSGPKSTNMRNGLVPTQGFSACASYPRGLGWGWGLRPS